MKIHKLVLERVQLFIHSIKSSEKIHRDGRWLENHLEVGIVRSIKKRLIFKAKNHGPATRSVDISAIVTSSKTASGKNLVLHITPNVVFYDLAQALVRVILDRPKPHSSLLLESLLSTGMVPH